MLEYLFKELIEDDKERSVGYNGELFLYRQEVERKELKVLIDCLKTMTDDWEKLVEVYWHLGRSVRVNVKHDNYYEIANFNFIEEEEVLSELNKAFGKDK